MRWLRAVFPRSAAVVCLTVLALEAVVLLSQWGRAPSAHGVRLGVAAPAVVAQGVVDQVNADPARGVEARVLARVEAPDAADAARRAVRRGEVFAAVAVNLTGATDTLFVSTAADPDLNRLVRARAVATENRYGRRLTVTEVRPTRNDRIGRYAPYLLTASWTTSGFLCVAVLTLIRGPVAKTLGRALARVFGLAGGAVLLGGIIAGVAGLAGVSNVGRLWLLGAAAILGAAWTTLSLESLAGLAGLGLAATLFGLLAGPLFALDDPALLPAPWAQVTPFTLHGAVLTVASRVVHFDGLPMLRALCVIAAWVVLPLLTMGVARRERFRAPTAGS